MHSFTAGWLALREPADAAARSAQLAARFAGRARRVVDLGSGTGANIRYLAPHLPGVQRWLAVDQDPRLLGTAAWPAETSVATLRLDFARALDQLPLESGDLVTASALLDLVSASWLHGLAARCAEADAVVLFALTYDGRIAWSPAEEGDAHVRDLLNRHQLRDKGFGPALGPDAAKATLEAFEALGYAMRTERSDWSLGDESHALQTALIDGWVSAAAELAPAEHEAMQEWANRRRSHLAIGRSRLRVGHLDVAGERR